jgi:hypothetical protein
VPGSFADEVSGFFNRYNSSSRIMVLGSTQPLTEMSTRYLPDGKGRPEPKADNLCATLSQLCRKCEILDVSQSYRPSRPVTGIALPYFLYAEVAVHVCSTVRAVCRGNRV